MKTLEYKNNEVQIKQLLTMLSTLIPSDDTYEYLMNELMIQVYTSYENFLKELLIHLFSEAKKNYKYSPFLVEHKLWGVTEKEKESYIVPKGKKESLLKNFPLLNTSYFLDDLDAVDTLVIERNSFAHTGTHKATLEQILTAYVTIKYIIDYLEFCYITGIDQDIANLKKLQIFLKKLKSHSRKCINNMGEITNIPEKMRAFEPYLEEISYFKDNNVYAIHPSIKECFKDETFLFLETYKGSKISDFLEGLDGLEQEIYLATFKVTNKDRVTPNEILLKFFNK